MSLASKVSNGCATVHINGKFAARQRDSMNHGGLIGEGCATVVIGGAAKPAARVGDRFTCGIVDFDMRAHVGGAIVAGSGNVLIGGRFAARMNDPTLCVGCAGNADQFADLNGGDDNLDADTRERCRSLWDRYEAEAAAMIAPAENDHRKRNHIITGAYADLYLRDRDLGWAGLAAYASKQVGCGIDQARIAQDEAKPNLEDVAQVLTSGIPGVNGPIVARKVYRDVKAVVGKHMEDALGRGNKLLFLDIYPSHRFFEVHGYARMKECAAARRTPLPAAVLDGFAALDKYKQTGDPADMHEHIRAIAYHEQVYVLQTKVYNDKFTRLILDANEGAVGEPVGFEPNLPPGVIRAMGGSPADVKMTESCSDPGGKKTLTFKRGNRENLYDVDQRMDWIMNDIGEYYTQRMGGTDHIKDMTTLRGRGAQHGAKYP